MSEQDIKAVIEHAFERKDMYHPQNAPRELKDAVISVLEDLDNGHLRVAEKTESGWQVNEWLKKAILLSFRLIANQMSESGVHRYFDKVKSKFDDWQERDFINNSLRVVPGAIARKGAYIAKNVVLMPSFINIGAYVGEGTMVDTWATVGSCAQIGKNVHLSGGVGIGGVLEPLQAAPTVIEDHCFIGARSEIVEGVVVEEGSVISMGVFIGRSTKIYDRETGNIIYGRVPKGSVVIPGSLPSSNGAYSLNCAVIVKKVDCQTLSKVGPNELLRGV